MSPNDDDRMIEPGIDDEATHEFKYRYKYRHKYGDLSDVEGEERVAAGQHNAPRDDGKPDRDEKNKTSKSDRNKSEDKDDEKDDEKDGDGDGDGDGDKDNEGDESPEEKKKKKRKRNIILGIIAAVFVIAGIVWLLLYLFVFSKRATTDDAYVQGNMVTISSRVSGTVVEVVVQETDRVYAGQVLVRLDPADAQVSLMNAEGQLAQAVRQSQQQIAQAAQADATVAQRRAQYESERDNLRRQKPLLPSRAVSKQDVDNSNRQTQAALAALHEAQAQARAAHALVSGTTVFNTPAVIQARANLRTSWINNGRNAIVSPVDGYASRRNVQVGQRVQPGEDLLTVVPLEDLWVDANFKETQLTYVRIGQPVTMTFDIYPDVTFKGSVVGLNAGTGSAFALLPAQNASGNWIKVVQRVPTRISLDPEMLRKHPLRIGLSAEVNIDIHDHDGAVLVSATREKPLATTAVYEREVLAADRLADKIIRDNTVEPTVNSATPTKTPSRH